MSVWRGGGKRPEEQDRGSDSTYGRTDSLGKGQYVLESQYNEENRVCQPCCVGRWSYELVISSLAMANIYSLMIS